MRKALKCFLTVALMPPLNCIPACLLLEVCLFLVGDLNLFSGVLSLKAKLLDRGLTIPQVSLELFGYHRLALNLR